MSLRCICLSCFIIIQEKRRKFHAYAGDTEFEDLCFDFGIELDDVVSMHACRFIHLQQADLGHDGYK